MSFSHPPRRDKPTRSPKPKLKPQAAGEVVPEATPKGTAHALALRLLLGRPLSAEQLYQKLREQHFDHQATQAACQAMRRYGYLDDAKLAEMVRASATRQGKGPRWIEQQLSRRKVAPELIGAAAKVPDDEALSQATALVMRRFAKAAGHGNKALQARALRFLAARGFLAHTAYAAVRLGLEGAQQAEDSDASMC